MIANYKEQPQLLINCEGRPLKNYTHYIKQVTNRWQFVDKSSSLSNLRLASTWGMKSKCPLRHRCAGTCRPKLQPPCLIKKWRRCRSTSATCHKLHSSMPQPQFCDFIDLSFNLQVLSSFPGYFECNSRFQLDSSYCSRWSVLSKL